MTEHTLLVYKNDTTYGGCDYIEFLPKSGLYAKGNTRSHGGHGRYDIEIEVARIKDLKLLEARLLQVGFSQVATMHGFGVDREVPKEHANKQIAPYTLLVTRSGVVSNYDVLEISPLTSEYQVSNINDLKRFGKNPIYLEVSTLRDFTSIIRNVSYHCHNIGQFSKYEVRPGTPKDYAYINKVLTERNTHQKVRKTDKLYVVYSGKAVARLLGCDTRGKSDREIVKFLNHPSVFYDNAPGGTFDYYVVL